MKNIRRELEGRYFAPTDPGAGGSADPEDDEDGGGPSFGGLPGWEDDPKGDVDEEEENAPAPEESAEPTFTKAQVESLIEQGVSAALKKVPAPVIPTVPAAGSATDTLPADDSDLKKLFSAVDTLEEQAEIMEQMAERKAERMRRKQVAEFESLAEKQTQAILKSQASSNAERLADRYIPQGLPPEVRSYIVKTLQEQAEPALLANPPAILIEQIEMLALGRAAKINAGKPPANKAPRAGAGQPKGEDPAGAKEASPEESFWNVPAGSFTEIAPRRR